MGEGGRVGSGEKGRRRERECRVLFGVGLCDAPPQFRIDSMATVLYPSPCGENGSCWKVLFPNGDEELSGG